MSKSTLTIAVSLCFYVLPCLATETPTETLPPIDLAFVEQYMRPVPVAKMLSLMNFEPIVDLANMTRALSGKLADHEQRILQERSDFWMGRTTKSLAEIGAADPLTVDEREAYLDLVHAAYMGTRDPLLQLEAEAFLEKPGRPKIHKDADIAAKWAMVGVSQVMYSAGVSHKAIRALATQMATYAHQQIKLNSNGGPGAAARIARLDHATNLFLMVTTKSPDRAPPRTCNEYFGRLRRAKSALNQPLPPPPAPR